MHAGICKYVSGDTWGCRRRHVIIVIIISISISISIIIIPATIRPFHHIHPIRHNMPSECNQKEQKLALGGT
jgi:hypothetical protein